MKCVFHHNACDCREEKFLSIANQAIELEKKVKELEEAYENLKKEIEEGFIIYRQEKGMVCDVAVCEA